MNNQLITLTPEQKKTYDYIIEHSKFSDNAQVQRYCQSRKILYHSDDIMKSLEDFAKWQEEREPTQPQPTSTTLHDAIMEQWSKDFGSPNETQPMNAYTVSGFLQAVVKRMKVQPVSDAHLFTVEQMREAFEQEMDKEMQLMMDALEREKYDKATMHEEQAAHIQHALKFMDDYLQSLTQNKEQ